MSIYIYILVFFHSVCPLGLWKVWKLCKCFFNLHVIVPPAQREAKIFLCFQSLYHTYLNISRTYLSTGLNRSESDINLLIWLLKMNQTVLSKQRMKHFLRPVADMSVFVSYGKDSKLTLNSEISEGNSQVQRIDFKLNIYTL